MTGILYIVSTPIGNLEDITLRALRVLKDVDIIAAEDTRHSLKLLNHYGIVKPMISYWKAREHVKSDKIIQNLHAGKSVALISDAGTPGIADPGMIVIQKAIQENIQVVSVPGPSACIAALTLSGIKADEFSFTGFLPAKRTQRQKLLNNLSLETRTLIFYEAPHRILDVLHDMMEFFNERKVAVVKEISKMHEHVFRGTLTDVFSEIQQTKIAGEYILIVEGRGKQGSVHINDALHEVHLLMQRGINRKDAVKRIASTYRLSKRELYEKSIDHASAT